MINQSERQPLWRKTGTDVKGMSIPDALTHSGIGFRVGIAPLTAVIDQEDGDTHIERVNGYQVTYREDNRKPIAPVGSRYHVVQTTEATQLIEEMTAVGWTPEFAGVIKYGRAVFMAGKLDMATSTNEIDPYLCFVNSFDGSSGVKFACTPLRPQCTNQVRAIFNKNSSRPVVSLRHTSNILKRTEMVRELLGLSSAYYEYLDTQIDRLLSVSLDENRIDQVLDVIAPLTVAGKPVADSVMERRVDKRLEVMVNLKHSTTINDEVRGTAWGLYNSITELEQWSKDTTRAQSEQAFGNHLGIVPMRMTSDRVYRVMEGWLTTV